MPVYPIFADSLPEPVMRELGDDFEVLPWNDPPDPETARRVLGLYVYGHPQVDAELLDRFPNLKVVSNHGVGVDHIDVAAAVSRGIHVGNTPGCLDQSTADMTLALLLAAARNVVRGDAFARGPEFTIYDPAVLIGLEVSGSTLGIVGLGRIGQQVARRALAFDMRVVYHNRRPVPEAEQELGVEYVSLPELLQQSDFVSLNCPLTTETTGLIGRDEFALMRPTSVLVNMARGPVVQTQALYEALRDGVIAAAGLDVTDPEPLPRDHPLLGLENLVITPHLGSASNRTRAKMVARSIANLRAGVQGKPLPYEVFA